MRKKTKGFSLKRLRRKIVENFGVFLVVFGLFLSDIIAFYLYRLGEILGEYGEGLAMTESPAFARDLALNEDQRRG